MSFGGCKKENRGVGVYAMEISDGVLAWSGKYAFNSAVLCALMHRKCREAWMSASDTKGIPPR